jgi:hypothetical protein
VLSTSGGARSSTFANPRRVESRNIQESERRQYALVDRARDLRFCDVVVIDEDLGRSGTALIERPRFERLVAEVF